MTDSRGFVVTKTIALTISNYADITTSKVELKRVAQTSSTIKLELTGTFYNTKIADKTNNLTVKYRYKESDGTWSSYITLAVTVSNNNFTYSNLQLRTDCSYQKSFDFEIEISDSLTEALAKKYTLALPISKGIPTFDAR